MADIYMDNAAGTRLLKEVLDEMLPFLTNEFGNPSSIHTAGTVPREAIELARERVAEMIGARPEEIYFTSCGSESNNMALKGIAWASIEKGHHIIISAIEHQSVMNTARALSKQGWDVTTIGVDEKGFIDPHEVAEAVRDDTVMISIVHASNEIGTIEPIKEITFLVKGKGIPIHTDAVQTVGVIPVNVDELKVDMLSMSSNSFYGPKSAAALYVRKGIRIFPLINGGIQERGKRAGTENVPAIVGLGKAAELAVREMDTRISSTTILRDRLMNGLETRIPKLIINGDRKHRLPGNVHASIEAVEGESMLYSLAGKGIMAASGSSCADRALKRSHVLTAIGVDPAMTNASLLFSLGFDNTQEEVDTVLEVLPPIVERLRIISTLW